MVEELYTQLKSQLAGYCRALTHDRAEAEDLVQETYLRAMLHLEDLRELSGGQRRAWLYKTAHNLFVDRIRKAAREKKEDSLEQVPFEPDLTGPAAAQLMSCLSPRDRAVFSLRHFAGYNASEIGEMLNMPPSTVRARLAAARRQLMKELEE